jgi:hypothetical protein
MDMHKMYYIFHVLFAAPLLIYIGIQGAKAPTWMYGLLGVLVLGIVGYHGYRAYQKIADGRSAWINWIHILLLAPVLGYIAVYQKDTERRVFEMAMMLGFAALGYHGYYLMFPH